MLGGTEKENGVCRILEEMDPEELSLTSSRVLRNMDPPTIRRIVLCTTRLVLENIRDIKSSFRKPEVGLRKMCLAQLGFGDLETQVHCLELMAALFNKRETNLRLVVLETELVSQFFHSLAKPEVFSSVDKTLWKRFSDAVFNYFETLTGLESNLSYLQLLRAKFFKPFLSALDGPMFSSLERSKQSVLYNFLISLLEETDCLTDDERDSLLRIGLGLENCRILKDLSWREMKGFSHIPTRSEKRKLDDEDEYRFNFSQSAVWRRGLELLQERIPSTPDLPSCIGIVNSVLSAGTGCLTKCLDKWPFLSYHTVDAETVSDILNLLLSVLEQGLDPCSVPGFFPVVDHLILLLNPCKNITEFLPSFHLLAGILSLPFLSGDFKGTDIKLGKFSARLSSAQQRLVVGEGRGGWVYRALLRLSQLPGEVCPRWRVGVFKTAAAKHPECIVRLVTSLAS